MMKPFGKTYLVKLDKLEDLENDNGILVMNPSTEKYISWKGTIVEYGAGFSEDETKDLLPIGSRVVMTYGKNAGDNGGIKLDIKHTTYMIRKAEEIVGVIEDE